MILALVFGRTISPAEARREFGVSPAQLKEWAAAGYIQSLKRSRCRVRYSRDEIVRMMVFGEDFAGRRAGRIQRDERALVEAAERYRGMPVEEWE